MVKITKIQISPYISTSLTIIFSTNESDQDLIKIEKYFKNPKRSLTEQFNKNAAGQFFWNLEDKGYYSPHIWLRKFNFSALDISVLVHELLHAVHYIMRFASIELCQESEEAFTYLLGYLTKKFLENNE